MENTEKKLYSDEYWTRVFIPCVLILLAFAFVLLFMLPQTQIMGTPSVYRALRTFQTIKSP